MPRRVNPPFLGLVVSTFLTLFVFRQYLWSQIIPNFLLLWMILFSLKVITFPRWHDEIKYFKRFTICFLILIVELLVENLLAWAVSAFDRHKHDYRSLQDNGEIVTRWLMEKSFLVNWLMEISIADSFLLLVIALMLPLSAAWDQMNYSGFGMMARYCLTTAISRSIRTASFLSTVVPSPRQGCYSSRFPEFDLERDGWLKFFRIAFKDLRGFGACNDLVFSGHAVLWALTPLLYQTFYYSKTSRLKRSIVAVLWLMVIQQSLRDVIYHQHYSVDMILGVLVTWLVWIALENVYSPVNDVVSMTPSSTRLPKLAVALIYGSIIFVGVVIFVAKS